VFARCRLDPVSRGSGPSALLLVGRSLRPDRPRNRARRRPQRTGAA